MAFSFLLIFTAMISIQLGASLAKQLFPVFGPEGTTSLRIGFAALILIVLFKPWKIRLPQNDYPVIAGYGAALGIMNLLFYLSLERIPLGIAVALEFTGPLAVSILSSRKAIDLLWVILAVLGICFVLPHGENITNKQFDILGISLALGAGFFWAIYIVLGQRAGKKAKSGTIAALGMGMAALVTIPFGVMKLNFEIFTLNILVLGILMAVLSSAIPYSLEMMALKRLPAKTFGILMSLEPAIAALVGLIFLSEQLTLLQWGAIACVMAASSGATLSHSYSNRTQDTKFL